MKLSSHGARTCDAFFPLTTKPWEESFIDLGRKLHFMLCVPRRVARSTRLVPDIHPARRFNGAVWPVEVPPDLKKSCTLPMVIRSWDPWRRDLSDRMGRHWYGTRRDASRSLMSYLSAGDRGRNGMTALGRRLQQ